MEGPRKCYSIDGITVTIDPELNQEAGLAYARSVIATRMECCLGVDTTGSNEWHKFLHFDYYGLDTSLRLMESDKPFLLTTLSNGKQLRVYPERETDIHKIDDDILELAKRYAEGAISIDKDDDYWYWED